MSKFPKVSGDSGGKTRREGQGEERGKEGGKIQKLSKRLKLILKCWCEDILRSCLGTDHKAASTQPGVPPGPQSWSESHPCASGHRAGGAFLPGKPSILEQRQAPQQDAVEPWPRGALTAQGPCRDRAGTTPPPPTQTPRATEQQGCRGQRVHRALVLSSDGGQAPPKELRFGSHSSKLHESKFVHLHASERMRQTRANACKHVRGSRSRHRECQSLALLKRAKSAGACWLQRH